MQSGATTEKQESYIKDLIESRGFAKAGNYQIAFTTAEDALDYAFALHMQIPEDASDASEMIDALKSGGPSGYAKRNPEFARRVLGPIGERFGGSWKAINEAAREEVAALDVRDRIRVQDSQAAFRELVLDPLLLVSGE